LLSGLEFRTRSYRASLCGLGEWFRNCRTSAESDIGPHDRRRETPLRPVDYFVDARHAHGDRKRPIYDRTKETIRCYSNVSPNLPYQLSPLFSSHTPHAQTARRANLPHASSLASSGKSKPCSRPSRLDEEGRFGRSSRHVRRGCGGRGGHVRRTWLMRTEKSCGSGAPMQALNSQSAQRAPWG
jgi:hypothetical protein